MATADSKLPPQDRWTVFYPVYIDSGKTLKQGRRVNKEAAVNQPTAKEIHTVVSTTLGLPAELEADKMYSRDYMMKGRVRVALKNEDGSLINPDIPSRKVLWTKVSSAIPQLKSRKSGGGGGGGGKKKNKKNKKKRKK